MSAPLFDSHCHLDFDSFGDELPAILQRAKDVGVTRIATIGSGRDVASAQAAVDLARAHPGFVVATVGVHPHDARVVDDGVMAAMERLAVLPEVVAVGEVGLDFHYDHSPREVQRDVFRRFIALAKRVKKPVTVHTREAADETLQILDEEGAKDVGGIIHCFSEDHAFAMRALDLGFVASFSGIVTFKNATAIRDAAARQPADAILVETDAPYLAPVPFRGKRNEPSWVAHTARAVAELRGEPEDSLRELTTRNAERIYRL